MSRSEETEMDLSGCRVWPKSKTSFSQVPCSGFQMLNVSISHKVPMPPMKPKQVSPQDL